MHKERPSFNCFPQISITSDAAFEESGKDEENAEIASNIEVANAFDGIIAINGQMSSPGAEGACGIWPPPRASARGGRRFGVRGRLRSGWLLALASSLVGLEAVKLFETGKIALTRSAALPDASGRSAFLSLRVCVKKPVLLCARAGQFYSS